MVAATSPTPAPPAATTLPLSPLPTLSPADSHLFNLFAASDLELSALAALTKKPLTELIPWATGPTIATWAAAWVTLTEQKHSRHAAAAVQGAIRSLTRLLETTTDPIETRRAACAIIRAATPSRIRTSTHAGPDGSGSACHGRAPRLWADAAPQRNTDPAARTAHPHNHAPAPRAATATAPIPASPAQPLQPTRPAPPAASPGPTAHSPRASTANRGPSATLPTALDFAPGLLSSDLAALLEPPPAAFGLPGAFGPSSNSPAARLARAAGLRGPAP